MRATPRDQNPRTRKKETHHNWLLSGSQIWVHSPRPPNVVPGPLVCCSPTAITPDSVFLFYTLAIYSRFLRGSGWDGVFIFFSKQIEMRIPARLSPGASPPLPRTRSRTHRSVRQKRRSRHASILGLRRAGGWAGRSGHPTLAGSHRADFCRPALRGKQERKKRMKQSTASLLASDEQGGAELPSREPARGDQLLHACCREGTSLSSAGQPPPGRWGNRRLPGATGRLGL